MTITGNDVALRKLRHLKLSKMQRSACCPQEFRFLVQDRSVSYNQLASGHRQSVTPRFNSSQFVETQVCAVSTGRQCDEVCGYFSLPSSVDNLLWKGFLYLCGVLVAVMSVLRKIQRVGKRATKFQYTATYQSVVVECQRDKW